MVALNEKTKVSPDLSDFGFDESFESKVGEAFPFGQLINPSIVYNEDGTTFNQPHGLGIRADNAERVGLTKLEENGWQLVDYQFTSGTEKVWITKKPRFVVIRKTPVYTLDRSTKRVIGALDKKTYDNRIHKPFTELFILILGQNNELLHAIPEVDQFDVEAEEALPTPIKVKFGGAGGSRFGAAYKSWDSELKIGKGFIHELELAYSQLRGEKTPKRMKPVWHSHGIFAPEITSKMAGVAPNVKPVCDFSKYEIPTPQNLGNNLVKANTDISKYIIALHNKYEEYLPKVGGLNDVEDEEDTTTQEFGTASTKRNNGSTTPASAYMGNSSVGKATDEFDTEYPPY